MIPLQHQHLEARPSGTDRTTLLPGTACCHIFNRLLLTDDGHLFQYFGLREDNHYLTRPSTCVKNKRLDASLMNQS